MDDEEAGMIGDTGSYPLRVENLITNIVYNACGRDVTHVFVCGECLIDEQRLTRFDKAEAIREVQVVAEKVWERSKPLLAAEGMP
ncbi:hypothetical protein [Lichenifustis flavocetrariae]|uniref:Uncharacterized protein n=1 Tax=Lichenifustis flavocetrariae TaxID=2949735 RepID=A0AA42CNS1_9HYPH|nr:hypothetical protein [Lichenifustis flavocetrariae]MCW6509665.1 hypothetical protein [Lichenifustis flavocetrariae]